MTWARGAQPERTALAWRRTAMAVVVLALGVARVAAPTAGWTVLCAVVAAVPAAVFVALRASARMRAASAVARLDEARLHGAVPVVLVGGGAAIVAVGSLLAVVALR